jgi:hypothetical protein
MRFWRTLEFQRHPSGHIPSSGVIEDVGITKGDDVIKYTDVITHAQRLMAKRCYTSTLLMLIFTNKGN